MINKSKGEKRNMEENLEAKLTADKQGVLEERTKEIEESGNYVQFKITCPTISEEELRKMADNASNQKDEISFGKLMHFVAKYIEKNVEYGPIFNISGQNVSKIDRIIALELAKQMIDVELINAIEDTNGGDE
jgi:hypothetical protein